MIDELTDWLIDWLNDAVTSRIPSATTAASILHVKVSFCRLVSTCIIILTIIRCRLKLQGELFFVNHFVVWLWLGFVTAAAMVAIIVKCNLGLELDCWCLSVCLSVFHFLYFLGPSPSHEFFFIFPFSHFGCGKDRQKGRQTDCRGIESSLLISLWRHPSWSSSVSFCKLMCTCNLIITCRLKVEEKSLFSLSRSLWGVCFGCGWGL